MQLCIDVGNTAIKYALFNTRKLIFKTSNDTFEINFLLALIHKYEPNAAIVSSVRSIPVKWLKVLRSAIHTLVLSHKTPLPLKLDYFTPETLGSDRIASSVGASLAFPKQNRLIINAGTCITYDIVTDKNVYKGGAIAPGIEMRYKAMHTFTAKLPYVTNRTPVRITGKNTEQSINAGVLNHVSFEIEGAIAFYSMHFKNLKVLLTGGNGPFLAKRLKSSIFATPDLVLTGLNEILLYNA